MRVMVLRRWLPGTCSARSCSPLAKLDREAPTWQAAAWAEGHLVIRDAGIKISSVATDILGVSGRAMLAALIEGEDDAQVMADMARGRMRTKIPALVQALTGSFGEHHSFLCRMHLTRIDELSATIEELSARIDQEMRPFAPQIERLVTIPGVKKSTAQVIIAETGADMTRFRTPANLASWAGVRNRVM